MVNLIDSHTGTMNVTAREVGYAETGLTGTGTFLLKLDDKFPTVNTVGNNVIIPMSFWLVDGRRFSVMNAETITSDIGQNGYNRIDLICLHYKCDKSTGVESVELVCVKGARTTGTAVVPSVKQPDLNTLPAESYKPLLRLNWSGTILQCVLADGVKQLQSTSMMMDSLDTRLTSAENNLHNLDYRLTHSAPPVHVAKLSIPYHVGVVTLTRIGNIVYANGEFYANSDFNGNMKTNETVPAGYRPQAEYANPAIISAMSHMGNGFYLTLSADGTMYQYGAMHMNYRYGLTGTWVTRDSQPS